MSASRQLPWLLSVGVATFLGLPVQATEAPAPPVQMITSVPQASIRPTLAVLPSLQISLIPYNDSLYARLTSALVRLGRFDVLERGRIHELVAERELVKNGYSEPRALGKLLNAQKLLIADMLTDPSGHVVDVEVDNGKGKEKTHTIRYDSLARASVRFIDVDSGVTFDAFEVAEQSSDKDSPEVAKDRAMDQLVDSIVRAIRGRTKLAGRIIRRDGYTVVIDVGGNMGLKPSQYFDVRDAQGEPVAELCVRKVRNTSAEAEIVRGYHRVSEGLRALEDPAGSAPLGVGYASRLLFSSTGRLASTFNGVDVQLSPLGHGLGLGLELGALTNGGGGNGLATTLMVAPQLDLIPERLWTYLSLGAGGEIAFASVPKSSSSATAFGAHLLGSLGIAGTVFDRLELFVEAGYMSPWTLRNWGVAVGDSDYTTVTSPMPTPTVGGPFLRLGGNWVF